MEKIEEIPIKRPRGRPKGSRDRKPRKAKPAYVEWVTPAEITSKHLAEDFENLVTTAKERALESGSVGDLIALMRLEHPGPQRRVNVPELALLRPEDRIVALNSFMLSGRVSLEDGKALIVAAEREFSATILAPLRAALMSLRAGATVEDVADKLASVAHRLALLDERRGHHLIEGKADAG